MLVNRVHPRFHILVRLLISQVEGDDDPVRLSVELVGDCAEALLACRVPNFDVEGLIVTSIFALDEVDAWLGLGWGFYLWF